MRKFLLLRIPFFVCFFSVKSYAITGSQLRDLYNDQTGYNFQNDYSFNQIVDFWSQNQDLQLCIYNSATIGEIQAGFSSNLYIDGSSRIQFTGPWYRSNIFQDSNQNALTWQTISSNGSANIFGNVFILDEYDQTDWNNILFDPLLDTPSFFINNNVHTGNYNIDLTFNQVSYTSPYNNVSVYLYVKAYLYTPSDVYADYSYFKTNSYYKSDPIIIFDYMDMHASDVNQTYDLNDYNDGVMDFIEYAAENRTIDSPSGMSAGTLLNRGVALSNMLTKGFPYGDNNIEIWACYYYVLDSVVYQGGWTKWNSKRNATYEKIVPVDNDYPTNGIIDIIDYQVTGDNQDVTDYYNPIGIPTGNDNAINVTVNTSVPNYPDYPTIVSYNKDAAFTNVLEATSYMADPNVGFFGQFGGFLSSIFSFIPSQIWFIIGTGFSVSIFVMFLKIL